MALFGSVARGQARPDSDLDLYVVARRPQSSGIPVCTECEAASTRALNIEALVRTGYWPTPSPIPHTVDDLARHPVGTCATSSRTTAWSSMTPSPFWRRAGPHTAAHGRAGLRAHRATGRQLVLELKPDGVPARSSTCDQPRARRSSPPRGPTDRRRDEGLSTTRSRLCPGDPGATTRSRERGHFPAMSPRRPIEAQGHAATMIHGISNATQYHSACTEMRM